MFCCTMYDYHRVTRVLLQIVLLYHKGTHVLLQNTLLHYTGTLVLLQNVGLPQRKVYGCRMYDYHRWTLVLLQNV